MEPFDHRIYVPILLTKRGERSALADIPDGVRRSIRPLFVVPEPDWDYDTGAPKKSVEDHIAALPTDLRECWGTGDAFVDTALLGDEALSTGDHPLVWLAGRADSLGLTLTPVVAMDSTRPYLDAVRELTSRGSSVCIRIALDHWFAGGSTQVLDDLVALLRVSAASAHVVLDAGDDVGAAVGRAALAELRSFPRILDWASVTLSATAIPVSMPSGGSTVHSIDRQDWRIYAAVCAHSLPRLPSFGDYAINGVGTGVDLDPRLMSIAATLRYTVEREWLISKGGLYKGSGGRSLGGRAVPPAALALTRHPDFLAGHCEFEDWLRRVADGGNGSSPEIWRRWATRHHLQFVTEQISRTHGP